jgi:hypothetical protein
MAHKNKLVMHMPLCSNTFCCSVNPLILKKDENASPRFKAACVSKYLLIIHLTLVDHIFGLV